MALQFEPATGRRWMANLNEIESAAFWEELELHDDLRSLDRIEQQLQWIQARLRQAV